MSRNTAPLLRTAAFVLLSSVAALTVAAVTAPAARAASGKAVTVEATELTPTPNPNTAYNRLAQTMGLFKKHDLMLKLGPNLSGGGPARVQAVATGNTELATGDIIAAMGGIYSGAKIKVLMVMTPYGDEEIWGRKKFKSLKDAENQPWGIASLGGAQRFNDQMTVEGMHLNTDAFRWVAIPGGDGPRLQALETGRVQLATLSHVGAALAQAKGFTGDVHAVVPHTSKYTPPIPRLVIVAEESWITSHEEAATRYVETMLDMSRQFENQPSSWVDASAAIFKKSGLSKKELKAVWQEFHDGGLFSVNGGINYAATQKVLDLFFKLRKESPNQYLSKASDIYDTGPLKRALDKMGVVKATPGLPDTPDWYHKATVHAE